jgi:hypothetical protein
VYTYIIDEATDNVFGRQKVGYNRRMATIFMIEVKQTELNTVRLKGCYFRIEDP